MKRERNTIILPYALLVLGIIGCGRVPDEGRNEAILARIGDKIITEDEFLRRAEYTIRPDYCKGDNYIHKKIILNSLIAEKLFALEAGDDNELTRTEDFHLYLQGRREQAMRQWLYYNDFYRKTAVDSEEVRQTYRLSNRTYKIAYYAIKDTGIVSAVREKLAAGKNFEQIFRDLGGLKNIPQREVSWEKPEPEIIKKTFFSRALKKNELIGPLQVEKNFFLLIKILGWEEKLLLSDQQVKQRLRNVAEEVRERYAQKEYTRFVRSLMKGKKVRFNPTTFRTVVEALGPFYMKTDEDRRKAFNERFWKQNKDEQVLGSLGENLASVMDEPFLTFDGETWTVREFQRALAIHPLVFRKRRMYRREFAEQFKLAVVDMIRDRFITREAYKKHYDRVRPVQQTVAMWSDYLKALYYKNRLLESLGKSEEFYQNYHEVIENDLNSVVDRMQEKYGSQIEIDTDLFEQIPLTRIDMFVLQKNVPFGVIVPSFPIITTDDRLDYGRKMN